MAPPRGIEPPHPRFGAGAPESTGEGMGGYRGIKPRVLRLEGAGPAQRVARMAPPERVELPHSGFVAQTPGPLEEANWSRGRDLNPRYPA